MLVTGHTGFKGTWLTAWLLSLGANVYGFAKHPSTSPSMYEACLLDKSITSQIGDLSDFKSILEYLRISKPKYIFHLAAQPIVSLSYQNPSATWQTNVMGGLNLLEAVRVLDLDTNIVFITSDKCYKNNEWSWGYRENDVLGGKDPYSASKAAAELLVHSYYSTYFLTEYSNVRIVTARAGNVIGGGDWSPDRIVPDCIRAWSADLSPELRNPHSTRPWQHVLEPIRGYLMLMQALTLDESKNGQSYNFGPPVDATYTVEQLVKGLAEFWPDSGYTIGKTLQAPECGLLKLNYDKSLHELNWKPLLDFQSTIAYTAEWYKHYSHSPTTILDFTRTQIGSYLSHLNTID